MKKSKVYHPSPRTSKLNKQDTFKVTADMSKIPAFFKILGFLVIGSIIIGFFVWKKNNNAKITYLKSIIDNSKNILGSTTKLDRITVDFNNQIAIGSPDIFGGAHMPDVIDQNVWNKLADIGITSIRRDIFLEYMLPANITLNDYKQNLNDVKNVKKWNQKFISETTSIFENAKKRGLKVIGIMSYSPGWLTYSGQQKAVPQDWEAYEEIVRNAYMLYRPYLDIVEIWNEPDLKGFLDTKDSGLSAENAYKLIFLHATNAIISVDNEINDGKHIKIAGPAVSNPDNIGFFNVILDNPELRSRLNILSYHGYASQILNKNIINKIHELGTKYDIYVSEWNKDGNPKKFNEYNLTDLSITYTASRILDFLNNGIQSASYFSLKRNNPNSNLEELRAYGFYRKINGKNFLLPQSKTWQLLSNDMELGKGKSRIFRIESNFNNSTAFINRNNDHGLAIVNENNTQVIEVNLLNLGLDNSEYDVSIYLASADSDAILPFCTGSLNTTNNRVTFRTILPESSVVGILLTKKSNIFSHFFDIMGASSTIGCIKQV